MAELVLCEPKKIYNLLNQSTCVPRLAQTNFLLLVDARETRDYRVNHIITAKHAKMDSENTFYLGEFVEIDAMEYVVVYDDDTCYLDEDSRARDCAQALGAERIFPVLILKGGFQSFSALYPFLRTEKILYTIRELETIKIYPTEIIDERLYMGDYKQALDDDINTDLNIQAVICISRCQINPLQSTKREQANLNVPLDDSGVSDFDSLFKGICNFIGFYTKMGSRVLIVSRRGLSRCSTITIAFLMHCLKYTLKASPLVNTLVRGRSCQTAPSRVFESNMKLQKHSMILLQRVSTFRRHKSVAVCFLFQEAWDYMLKCKPNMRPNTAFLGQLSDWELHERGQRLTDISEL